MNRLTELYTDLEIEIHNSEPEARHLEKGDFRPKNNALLSDCVQKLGQLEDIEDELGIDLITLFKANLKGVYLKDLDVKFPVMLRMGEFNHAISLHTSTHLGNVMLKVEDYGKTWALTKEELER